LDAFDQAILDGAGQSTTAIARHIVESDESRIVVRPLFFYRGSCNELDELYDLKADPFELTNLASDPAHHALRGQLRQRLRELVAEALGL